MEGIYNGLGLQDRFRGSGGRFAHGLQTAVRAGPDPDDKDQPDNDPDDIGDNVEKRIKAERDFPHAAATSDHGFASNWVVDRELTPPTRRFRLLRVDVLSRHGHVKGL